MKWMKRFLLASPALFLIVLPTIALRANLFGQQSTTPSTAPASGTSRGDLPQPMNWTAEEDHQNMMDQLGIKALRPGPSGRSEEHTSELQSRGHLVCRLLLEKKKNKIQKNHKVNA